jgi:hypothetical protein
MIMDVLELAVRQPLQIRVNDETLTVHFTVLSSIALESRLGRSMKDAADWFRIRAAELPAVLEEGLRTEHAARAAELADAICNTSPEATETIIQAVCATAYPDATRRLKEEMERLRDRIRKGLPLPNVPSVAVS